MSTIPPVDLTQQYRSINGEIEAVVLEVLASGRYIGGENVDRFEEQFAAYLGAAECVSCHSGTDALYLALRSLDIGPGDEVITTPFTFFATAEAICQVGAKPVFVDIEPDSFNINPELLREAINRNTKAILPVHLFGQPANMTQILAVASKHNIPVVEDCAQATGAEWQGKKVGTIGRIGCFSFFPTKNLGAFGDGGAVVTSDRQLAEKMRTLKCHGERQRYYHEAIGINSRLDAVQAAILLVKLQYLDTWNQRRREIADRYFVALHRAPELILPRQVPDSKCVWHQYTVRVQRDPQEIGTPQTDRDRLRQQLDAKGIKTMVYYPQPLHLQPALQPFTDPKNKLPVAERASREVLSLPMFPELTPQQQDKITRSLQACFDPKTYSV